MDIMDRMKALVQGQILMLPQNYYAQGFRLTMNENGDFTIHTYIPGEEDKEETHQENLDMLMDLDSTVWEMWEKDFPEKTVEAFCEYFTDDDEIEYEGPLATKCECNRCGANVVTETSEDVDYLYYCIECNENMYSFEVLCLENIPTYSPLGDNIVLFTLMKRASDDFRLQSIADKATADLIIDDTQLKKEYKAWNDKAVEDLKDYLENEADG